MQYMIKTVKKYFIPHEGNNFKPHLLRGSGALTLTLVWLVLFATSLGSSYLINKTDFGATVLPAVLVDLTNEHRIENNGKALTVSPVLEKAAMMKARDMAENQYFAHVSPTGSTPWQWFTKAGYKFSYAGENLAINFTESADVEKAWIGSPTHEANLVSDKFDETGIATYQGMYKGQPTTFVVQLFGRQARPRVAVTNTKPISSSLPETQPVKLADNKTASFPEVKGESVAVTQAPVDLEEPAPVLVVNEPTFSVAQNINADEPDVRSGGSTQKYSTLGQRLLVNQSRYVQYIYLGFIALVYLVLIMMVVVEFRTQHFKNIALGIILLCILGALAYVNSTFVLSFF